MYRNTWEQLERYSASMPLFYLCVRDRDHRYVKTLPTYFPRVVFDFELVPDRCSKKCSKCAMPVVRPLLPLHCGLRTMRESMRRTDVVYDFINAYGCDLLLM